MRVRVAAYNVQGLRAGMGPVAEVLRDLRPDLVLVQECGPRRALRSLATSLQMEAVSSHRPFRRVRNAVLFRLPWHLVGVEVRNLSREGRTLPRGLVAARLRRSGQPLTAVSSHLGLAARERVRHARELTDFLAGVGGPVVLGADLNEGPEGDAARWVGARLFDVWPAGGEGRGETFPASAPTARIDYLFVSDGLEVVRAWVASGPAVEGASDHRPVVADLELPGDRA